MIVGLGTDIVEVARIARIYDRFGNHFLDKILTSTEKAYLLHCRPEAIAGHFAAKEAAVKALGTGFAYGIGANSIEVCHQSGGAPQIHFLDAAEVRAQAMGVCQAFLSISHERNYAVATVILEGGKPCQQ